MQVTMVYKALSLVPLLKLDRRVCALLWYTLTHDLYKYDQISTSSPGPGLGPGGPKYFFQPSNAKLRGRATTIVGAGLG